MAFRIAGHPGTWPNEFMAVNAHLYFGNYIGDRRQEFNALVDWIMDRSPRSTRQEPPVTQDLARRDWDPRREP